MLPYQTHLATLIWNLQREDPGALVQLGYTAGARSWLCLGWARNLRRKLPNSRIRDLTYQSSSVFGLAWNMFQMQLPDEVIEDFNKWLEDSQIVKMNPSGNQKRPSGKYTICNGENPVTFHDVELAPPAGVFGANYTRYLLPPPQ